MQTPTTTTTTTATTSSTGAVLLAPSAAVTDWSKYDAMYYLKGAAAGGICCSVTHGALTPVDVVKTRVQLDSAKVRFVQHHLTIFMLCCGMVFTLPLRFGSSNACGRFVVASPLAVFSSLLGLTHRFCVTD
jgi:Mitochondrial carrier protein